MAWRSPGTGNPHFFRCSHCRKAERNCDPPSSRGRLDRIRLTGGCRPNRRIIGRSACSPRMAQSRIEYVCLDCGHRGWSAHIDIVRKFHAEDPQRPLFEGLSPRDPLETIDRKPGSEPET